MLRLLSVWTLSTETWQTWVCTTGSGGAGRLPRMCLAVFISGVIWCASPCELDPVTVKWVCTRRHMDTCTHALRPRMGADNVAAMDGDGKMERVIPGPCITLLHCDPSCLLHLQPDHPLWVALRFSFVPQSLGAPVPFQFHSKALFFFYTFNLLTAWVIFLSWST